MIYVLTGVILACIALTLVYNKLIYRKNKVENSLQQIDTLLKKKLDLIPVIIEIAKECQIYTKTDMEGEMEARFKCMPESADIRAAERQINGAVSELLSVFSAYSELQTNILFNELQEELSKSEDKISFAKQIYNDVAKDYNNRIALFPNSIAAYLLGFKQAVYFNED